MFTNVIFYIYWAVLAFIPVMLVTIWPSEIRKKIIAYVVVLAISFGITAITYINAEYDDIRWNNGICQCGGTYNLTAATRVGSSKTFYYTCDICGHTEEFSGLRK